MFSSVDYKFEKNLEEKKEIFSRQVHRGQEELLDEKC
jgi:hypothetical protein